MRCVLVALCLALVCPTPRTQPTCVGPQQVSFVSYGESCSFFLQDATLSGAYDPASCTMTLTQTLSSTCCNTFPTNQFLLFGLSPAPGTPLPGLAPGCSLLVQPLFFAGQPAPLTSTTGTWDFVLPAVPFPVVLYVQGLNQYFTTVSFSNDFQTTNGLEITIS